MAQKDIITLSPEGYVAIPAWLRRGFKNGDALIVIRDDDKLIIQRLTEMDEQLQEDLEFASRTRNAWKRYKKGEFKSMDFDEFLEQLRRW